MVPATILGLSNIISLIASPEQIACVARFDPTVGFGLTFTAKVKVLPKQVPEVAVTL
jgi:hypothetical protein